MSIPRLRTCRVKTNGICGRSASYGVFTQPLQPARAPADSPQAGHHYLAIPRLCSAADAQAGWEYCVGSQALKAAATRQAHPPGTVVCRTVRSRLTP
jgi:hypothetical protein